jgi:hypothetical protein
LADNFPQSGKIEIEIKEARHTWRASFIVQEPIMPIVRLAPKSCLPAPNPGNLQQQSQLHVVPMKWLRDWDLPPAW